MVSAGHAGPLAHSRTGLIQATRYGITATDPLPGDFRLAPTWHVPAMDLACTRLAIQA